MEFYIEKIKKIIGDALEIELISETSNKVFRVVRSNGNVLYAKFYLRNSYHIDNELKIYGLVDDKYLKELYYRSSDDSFAIFNKLEGKTIDELTQEELYNNSSKIIFALCEYLNSISKINVEGYGKIDENLHGKYNSFIEFLKARQNESSIQLKKYEELSVISKIIFDEYEDILYSNNSLVPIDNNMKNVMLTNDGLVKFIDPGEMISGPVLMGYGDFVAHTYKTVLYDALIRELKLTENEEKLLRIYAIFSSLNILAFLDKLGVDNLTTMIPYGNFISFNDLIFDHLEYLNISKEKLKSYCKKS